MKRISRQLRWYRRQSPKRREARLRRAVETQWRIFLVLRGETGAAQAVAVPMKEFRFKTPGGEHVERTGEVVFYRTPKGEDLYKILLLVEERSRTTDEKRRDEIIHEILPLKQAFEAVWNENPLDLIDELFGIDEGDDE